MIVYLVNIALILFWRLYFMDQRTGDSRKRYCGIVALQWILISGLRDWSVGADTFAYSESFERVKAMSWGSVLGDVYRYLFLGLDTKDPGYEVFTKVFQIFFKDYQMYLLVIALLFMTLMALWIYRNSSSPCTSFILFSTLFYSFYAITGHRQTIATALMSFAGYELVKKRKFWRFCAVTFVSYLIHKSSLVFVPVYFLARVPVTMGYMILCAVVIVVMAVFGKSLYGPVALWLGYGEHQVDYAEGGAELYALLLIALCMVVWILYPRIRERRDDAPLLFHINAMTLLTGLFVIQNQGFMRIQQYFSLFIMITVPEIINTIKREYRLLVYLVFGAIMIAYLIHNNPEYSFCFMS